MGHFMKNAPLRRDLAPREWRSSPWKTGQIPQGRIDTSALAFGVIPRVRERIKPHDSLTPRRGWTFCEWCGDDIELPQDPHHIISRGAGGPDHAYNLMMLCGKQARWGCHRDAHTGGLSAELLLSRHATLFPEIRDREHLLEEIRARMMQIKREV
jgi:hypothetical protein